MTKAKPSPKPGQKPSDAAALGVSRPSPMLPVRFRIAAIVEENHDTFTWTLTPLEPGPIAFAPGQFNMLYVFGVGEVPISISGDPQEGGSWTHTIRAVGTVTKVMQRCKPGDIVGLRGPFGSAWPIAQSEGHDLLILAGGIGLAPLRPVIYAILAQRARYGRVSLLVGARNPQAVLFQEELEAWRRHIDVFVTVDIGLDGWQGHVGVVTTLIDLASFDPHFCSAMMCGPEIMMHFCVRELLHAGLPPEAITLSMERNMKCAVGWCGHCQLGPSFVCKDGPVYSYPTLQPILAQAAS